MNIRITTFSLVIAATCGLAFNTAAKADEDDNRPKAGGMRFHFAANEYPEDSIHSRPYGSPTHGITHSSVRNGGAPKNLLGLDPSFVSKPAPMPVAQPPRMVPTVAARPIIAPTSPFQALFGHPTTAPLIAAAPGSLPGIGSPAKPAGHLPGTHASTNTAIKLIHAAPRHANPGIAARTAPAIASYPSNVGYSQGDYRPGYSGSGNHVDTSLSGRIIQHKNH